MKRLVTFFAVIITFPFAVIIAQTPKNNDIKWTFEEHGSSRIVYEIVIIGQKNNTDYSMALAYTDEHHSDTIIVEKYYFWSDKKIKQVECVGCVNLDVPSFLLSVPTPGRTTYAQVREAVDSFMQPYLNTTNNEELQALEQAANDSRKRLRKKVGSLSVSCYNINSDKGIFKYSGIMSEPFDFMEEAAIDEYIAKKAKKFKYTKSTHKADIKKAMLNGDPETIKFVNTCLNDEIEF